MIMKRMAGHSALVSMVFKVVFARKAEVLENDNK